MTTGPYPGFGAAPPWTGHPPPPKKNRAGLIAAAVTGALVLGAGGAFAKEYFSGGDPGTAVEKTTSSVPSQAAAPTLPSAPTYVPPQGSRGRSAQEQEYFTRLVASGVSVTDPDAMVRNGQRACAALAGGGNLEDAAMASSQGYPDEELRTTYGILVSVVSVQTLCPQDTPLRQSQFPTDGPVPPGRDGEFIRRLQEVGIGIGVPADAIRDAQGGGLNGQDVCSIVQPHTRQSLTDAVGALTGVNPATDKTGAIFFVVIATQVYCPVP